MICRLLLGAALLAAAPAAAQSLGIEATNDEVRRGLSWSGGDASLSADGFLSLGPVEASVRAAALRGSNRHADADAVVDASLAAGWDIGAARLRVEAIHHLFADAGADMDYTEVGASAGITYGPAQLTGGALFAPSQSTIGGSNLYLYATASAGLIGTPFTLNAGVGHSSGKTTNPLRAQRLRPGGDYLNWRLGAEYRQGLWSLGLDYIGTDVSRAAASGPFADARHAGDKLVARLRLAF